MNSDILLYQICGQFPDEELGRLRIVLDNSIEFSHNSDDYVRYQHTKIAQFEIREDYRNRTKILIAFTKEQPKKEDDDGPDYKPEKPRYGHIGI